MRAANGERMSLASSGFFFFSPLRLSCPDVSWTVTLALWNGCMNSPGLLLWERVRIHISRWTVNWKQSGRQGHEMALSTSLVCTAGSQAGATRAQYSWCSQHMSDRQFWTLMMLCYDFPLGLLTWKAFKVNQEELLVLSHFTKTVKGLLTISLQKVT